MSVCRKRQA